MTCFLDMDGVIADFMTAICAAHGWPSPYTHPEALGIWDTEKLWGISAKEFWAPIQGESLNFWRTIKKTQEADAIVRIVCEKFGQRNVAILTAPSNDVGSVPGKRWWIEKYYPQFSKQIIFTGAKQFLAGPDKILIDDRDKNVEEFREAGGKAVLIPRLWNSAHFYSASVSAVLRTRLED